ncbi:MAG: O-antigen ligase family protein [Gemmatimonadetes bacterium]|nr:O-antigen ligase family protein [Gemmatimonadota bacterium]
MTPTSAAPPTDRSITDWIALVAIVVGALAAVLLVLPYRSFDLDRFLAPKELAVHVAAAVTGTATLAHARGVRLGRADFLLGAWLVLSLASGLFATNHWAAFRAITLSVSGAIIYWSARRLAVAGLAGILSAGLAAVVVIGAGTALAQAYGARFDFATLSRAPGGTFGNRNFMAHLAAAGVPLLVWGALAARRRTGTVLTTIGLLACAAALVLSRTRAAWLALMIGGVMALALVVRGPALLEPAQRRRVLVVLASLFAGVVLALTIPNALDWKSDNPYLESVKGVVNYKEGSGRGRLKQYVNSLKMTASHAAFGVGPGNWAVQYPAYAPSDDPSIAEATGMAANPWPSSDWVAAVSERGPIAALALIAFFFTVLSAGVRARYDATRSSAARLAALAGVVTVFVAVVEGAFDAVLLLPMPLILVMAATGALLPAGKDEGTFTFAPPSRVMLPLLLLAAQSVAIITSAGRVEAMRLYGLGTVTALESATARDPGNFRIRVRAAETQLARGKCADARAQALAARALFPQAPAPKRVLAACPGKP